MTRIAPAGRIGAALLFSAALVGGVGVADAKPCLMQLPNGQWAPCAPPVISTMPGEYGDAGSGAVESESPELSMVSVAPSGGGGGDASGGGDADDGPIDEHEVSIPQPDDDPKDSGGPGGVDTPPKDEKDPDKLKEEQAQKEREEREKAEKEKAEKEKAEQAEKEKAEKEKAEREKQEQADKEKEQNQP
ncbi:hypothetical protein [Gordonia paraffinivorans]|uniref:hypothetical protein n=1 Tax=Gordonia paraffinivorans TaxID=175628 RepID=UPI0014457268|nr:hypothetical protein [Gordonia paraffinivorans]